MKAPQRGYRCQECRKTHQVCSWLPGSSPEDSCTRCARLGRTCRKGPEVAIHNNETSELRFQISRLGDVLRSFSDAEDGSEEDGQSSEGDAKVPLDDLCDRLTQLCFADEGLMGPPFDQEDEEDLIQTARCVLDDSRRVQDGDLERGGFTYRDHSQTSRTIADLVRDLPPWDEMERCLREFPMRISYTMEAILTPRVPRSIEAFYHRGCRPQPDPAQVAEMFSFLAIHEATLAVKTSAQLSIAFQHVRQAEEYVLRGQEALAIGDALERPTLAAVRAYFYLCYVLMICWIDASQIRKGTLLLLDLMSMIYRLGWNEDLDLPHESAVDRYERKAAACAVARLYFDQGCNWASSRKLLFRHSTFTCSVPNYLDESDLARDPRYELYRALPETIEGLAKLSNLALMRGELHQEILVEGCTSERLESYLDRLHHLRAEVFSGNWRILVDSETQQKTFAIPYTDLPLYQRDLRSPAMASCSLLTIFLHMHFLFGSNARIAARHREGLVQAALDIMAGCSDWPHEQAAIASSRFTAYPLFVASALLITSTTDLTSIQLDTCERLFRYFLVGGLTWPGVAASTSPAASRLVQLLQFLLDTTISSRRQAKKSKTMSARRIRNYEGLPMQPDISETSSDSFTFEHLLVWPEGDDPDAEVLTRKLPGINAPSADKHHFYTNGVVVA